MGRFFKTAAVFGTSFDAQNFLLVFFSGVRAADSWLAQGP